jgi:15-cis-phytoene synthase / lycopene beta-cyclase
MLAFDTAIAVMEAFPGLFPTVPTYPTPALLMKAHLTPTSDYDSQRILGFQQALERLRAKSRSFYLASGVFQGRTRIDLTLL